MDGTGWMCNIRTERMWQYSIRYSTRSTGQCFRRYRRRGIRESILVWNQGGNGDEGSGSALSEEEISGKVGNTVTYEANTVQINEEQLEIEGYETMQDVYTPDSIKEDYKADLSDWEDGVENISFGEVISSEDQEFFGDTFFVTDTGELWIYQEGVFFRTEKAE